MFLFNSSHNSKILAVDTLLHVSHSMCVQHGNPTFSFIFLENPQLSKTVFIP